MSALRYRARTAAIAVSLVAFGSGCSSNASQALGLAEPFSTSRVTNECAGETCFVVLALKNTSSSPIDVTDWLGVDNKGRTFSPDNPSDETGPAIGSLNPGLTSAVALTFTVGASTHLTSLKTQIDGHTYGIDLPPSARPSDAGSDSVTQDQTSSSADGSQSSQDPSTATSGSDGATYPAPDQPTYEPPTTTQDNSPTDQSPPPTPGTEPSAKAAQPSPSPTGDGTSGGFG